MKYQMRALASTLNEPLPANEYFLTSLTCSTRGWSPPLARVPQPVTRAGTLSDVSPGPGRHTGLTPGERVRAWASWITATS